MKVKIELDGYRRGTDDRWRRGEQILIETVEEPRGIGGTQCIRICTQNNQAVIELNELEDAVKRLKYE